MSKPTKAEKLVQDRVSKEEIAAMKLFMKIIKKLSIFIKSFMSGLRDLENEVFFQLTKNASHATTKGYWIQKGKNIFL
ncbi:hypothetical protein [Lactococcus garvieae]|uniref:hypothetical protein n=1 Tax=Lactococcus garvieae TaxID=1363 RepID=UPI003132EA69